MDPADRRRTVRGRVHAREKENRVSSALYLRATVSSTVRIWLIRPMPLHEADSAIRGETILSSLPSSHRSETVLLAVPSETVIVHEGL